ncbi:MAG TPA: sigma-54 dependent transcriptional regulator [Vicinamibacteria bacterium]
MNGRGSRGRVLVVEDETYVRDSLVEILRARGFDASAAASVKDALELLGRAPVDVVLSDLRMPGEGGLDLVRHMKTTSPDVPVLILTGHGTVASAVECLKAGASDYVLKPVEPDALELALERALEGRALRREVRYLRSAVADERSALIGEGAAWRQALAMVEAAAPVDAVVLITGESGTGKELLARRLHALSARAAAPFVKVNCAAVPLEIWESEFFGHRKGSFTGASADRDGRFQLADRGTLLLDEVGAMPLQGQAKLLRAIQDGEFERLGDQQATRVDVRVIASTNSDLEAEVQAGRFRTDLFYRLNVVRIQVAALRERREDIPLLARHFAAQIAARLGRPAPDIEPATLARLAAYHWPGNVRELRNIVERMAILTTSDRITAASIPLEIRESPSPRSGNGLQDVRDAAERDRIRQALDQAGWNVAGAARLLGTERTSLHKRIRALDIRRS